MVVPAGSARRVRLPGVPDSGLIPQVAGGTRRPIADPHDGPSAYRHAQEDASSCPGIGRLALAWSSSADGTCPSSTPASPTSTWRCGRVQAFFDVSHMGEIEIAGKDALAAVQQDHLQRRIEAGGQSGAVRGAHDARGHVRRRRAHVPAERRALHARRQRVEHHQGLQLDFGPRRRGGRCRGRQHELALRADRACRVPSPAKCCRR